MASATVMGIDLGTSNCKVAVYSHGRAEVIANIHGNRATPCFVAFDEDLPEQWIAGEDAKSQFVRNPTRTIFHVKRIIGKKISDSSFQQFVKVWPFKVVDFGGSARFRIKGAVEDVSPEYITAVLLKSLKDTAQDYLGIPVKKTVITIPACFDDAQKTASLEAAKLAGLDVLCLLTDPLATLMAHTQNDISGKTVLVVDFGGGTLDVSVIEVKNADCFEIRAMSSDEHLGGEDLDQKLAKYLGEKFSKDQGIDLMQHPTSFQKLRDSCENAKRTLSRSKTARVFVENMNGQQHLEVTLTRETFEKVCESLLMRVLPPVERVLRLAGMQKHRIDQVVLAGGSCKIPKVQEYLTRFFDGKKLVQSVDPEQTVAIGAVLKAFSILTGKYLVAGAETSSHKKLLAVEQSSLRAGGSDRDSSIIDRDKKLKELKQFWENRKEKQLDQHKESARIHGAGTFSCPRCARPMSRTKHSLAAAQGCQVCSSCKDHDTRNVCELCKQTLNVEGGSFSHADKRWHEACFMCQLCKKHLAGKSFVYKNERISCAECYESSLGQCEGCQGNFKSGTTISTHNGRQWHTECFICTDCKVSFGTKSFTEKEQRVYCIPCYHQKFSARCTQCSGIIVAGGITFENAPYHEQCFLCANCNTQLAGKKIRLNDERHYCTTCHADLFAERCAFCMDPIVGVDGGAIKFVSFERRQWHRECFKCSKCDTSLIGKGFHAEAEKILCSACSN